MHMILYFVVLFLSNKQILGEILLSKKVTIAQDNIDTIFKCPVVAVNETDIDASVLIFKSPQLRGQLRSKSIILSNQSNFIMHSIKSSVHSNGYTFAYASMASLIEVFDTIKIETQPGMFLENSKNSKNYEEIPSDQMMSFLKTKTPNENVFKLENSPAYRCLGTAMDHSYVMVEATSEAKNLKINDIIYNEESNGYLETIDSVQEINFSNVERLLIETKLTDCNTIIDKLENKISHINLVDLKTTDLNCVGGQQSDLSAYLVKNTQSLEGLVNKVIVGRRSSKFALQISSIKRIGRYLLFECASLNNNSKFHDYHYDYSKGFSFNTVKSVSFQPSGFTSALASASASFQFNPNVSFSVDIGTSWGIPTSLQGIGLTVGAEMILDFNLNINLTTINYKPSTVTLITKSIGFSVPIFGIPIPGTIDLTLTLDTDISLVFPKPVTYQFEYLRKLSLNAPFKYVNGGTNIVPTSKSFVISSPAITSTLDLSGLAQSPTMDIKETFNFGANPKWPYISTDDLEKILPWPLSNYAEEIEAFIQISLLATLPVTEELTISCSKDCPAFAKTNSIQLTSSTSLNPLTLAFSWLDQTLSTSFAISSGIPYLVKKCINVPFKCL